MKTAPSDDPTVQRPHGYVPLRSYAAIGDGRSVALVARDGAVDWYAVPEIDSPPVFARLLDAQHGGAVELCPVAPFTVSRDYLPGTNILTTTYTTDDGQVQVTDSLNTGAGGRLRWGEMARRIEGLDGSVMMRWRVAPGDIFGTASPWVQHTPFGPVIRLSEVTMGLRLIDAGECEVSDRTISGGFTTEPGSEHLVAVLSNAGEPLPLPHPDHVNRGIDRTAAFWRAWTDELDYDGPWAEAVLRSALTLRLLTHIETGAISAAATTSLPESWSGGKNWDYRFAWIRDAAYTLHTLIRFGESEEVHGAVSWLLRTISAQGPDPEVFTHLDGRRPAEERRVDAPGWCGIGPVVVGNDAVGQLQLGVFGDLFDMVALYVEGGNVLNVPTARLLSSIADHTCDVWRRRDAGTWELHTDRHYTSSKMGCGHALDCAVKLAEAGHIQGEIERWRSEAKHIREWVAENCWSEEKQSYVWYPGTEKLDASVILHAISGFDRGPRMSATIDAMRRELSAGPLMYRYSGADEEEATFVACAFWAAAALAEVGRRDEARELMDELVGLCNDVGLLTEMIDATDMSFLGNAPQALSHLALMTAALSIIGKY
ncbi:glycoside hydrolase family 15 protein [Mycobacterium sp. SMC-4]|uniref:glycoside hydrolase family 15 protein n=1 Tax=Mycobacterium sp. SMC-4 TaxID=2857059 RepID=UPI0021B27B75|nr:glycoside hydrolase family 15 protein [Mycobacterium sp. SMC-4]UXA17001.1 glycoside hydrolase family 15 protein [Mycobacterium sp. SMC-4]